MLFLHSLASAHPVVDASEPLLTRELLRSFGYDSAFIGTTIARKSFVSDFGITPDTSKEISSNITSAFQAGALGGALMCFFSA